MKAATWMFMATIAFAVANTAMADGPFGVTMGSSIAEYSGCKKSDQPNWYDCKALPKSHPEMEGYQVQAHPKFGVCFVKGIGKNISDSSFGSTTARRVRDIAAQIAQKYGPHSKDVDLFAGRLWDGADEWLMAIRQRERMYGFVWETQSDAMRAANIRKIFVLAKAADSSTGYIVAEFYFENEESCEAAIESDAARAF